MSENSNPAPQRRFGTAFTCLSALGGIALAGLLTANVWLVSKQLSQQRTDDAAHRFWTLCGKNSPPEQRAAAFLSLIGDGHTEWRSADLSHLQLAGANLNGAQLREIDFNNSDLEGARFDKADLYRSRFDVATLTRTSFREAELSEAIFFQADLTETDYTRAILRNSSLEQTQGTSTVFVLADMTEAYLLMARLSGANLSGADLTGANLEAADFSGTNLALARLTDTNVLDTDFSNSNWWRARGWTSSQLEELKRRFPPTEDADEGLRDDYRTWLGKNSTQPAGPDALEDAATTERDTGTRPE